MAMELEFTLVFQNTQQKVDTESLRLKFAQLKCTLSSATHPL